MKIFLTGGTGFIGSHFLKQALAAGHEVVALRRPGASPRIALEQEPTWIEGGLDGEWSGLLKECDALVHLAAQGVSPQPTDWDIALDINVRQSICLVHLALTSGVSHIIACGSCMEYGASGERYEYIPVTAPLEPIGPYATSKALFAVALAALARNSDAKFQLLRPFHLFGEGQHDSNFWPSLRKAALAGEDYPMTAGEQIRDYQEVGAAAASIMTALSLAPSKPGLLHTQNLGSGMPVSLYEFASHQWKQWEAKGKLLPGALPYRSNEVMRFVPEI